LLHLFSASIPFSNLRLPALVRFAVPVHPPLACCTAMRIPLMLEVGFLAHTFSLFPLCGVTREFFQENELFVVSDALVSFDPGTECYFCSTFSYLFSTNFHLTIFS
jgi:hypothetical protein